MWTLFAAVKACSQLFLNYDTIKEEEIMVVVVADITERLMEFGVRFTTTSSWLEMTLCDDSILIKQVLPNLKQYLHRSRLER